MIKNVGHTGLNTHQKNGGREQDSGETESKRGRETVHCCKQEWCWS
jgi:hypothetical protein